MRVGGRLVPITARLGDSRLGVVLAQGRDGEEAGTQLAILVGDHSRHLPAIAREDLEAEAVEDFDEVLGALTTQHVREEGADPVAVLIADHLRAPHRNDLARCRDHIRPRERQACGALGEGGTRELVGVDGDVDLRDRHGGGLTIR